MKLDVRKDVEFGWETPLPDDILIGFVRFTEDICKLGVSKSFKEEKISDKWTWVARLGELLEKELQQDKDEYRQIGLFEIIEKRKSKDSSTADPILLFQSFLSVSCKVKELKPNKAGRLV